MPFQVIIPLLNPNEPEAKMVVLHIHNGQQVRKGQPLCTLETTKSISELEAESEGFVVGLTCQEGQIMRAGETLCYLAEDPSWTPPDFDSPKAESKTGLRISQPALVLAKKLGVNIEELASDRFITEDLVRTFQRNLLSTSATLGEPPGLSTSEAEILHELFAQDLSSAPGAPASIIVYGCGGHGKTLVDLIRTVGVYQVVGFIDDGFQAGEQVMGLPVLGGSSVLPQLRLHNVGMAVNAVGGIGNLGTRIKVSQILADEGFTCPSLVHPSAVVESSAGLSSGVQVFAHAYLGSEAKISHDCIINTSSVVSHDCILGEYANISPGAMLAGEVQIGARVLVGMGATINLRVKVGDGARIGNGATVKEDVPENGIVRAGEIWP
jgi:acetyltransferase EpsM